MRSLQSRQSRPGYRLAWSPQSRPGYRLILISILVASFPTVAGAASPHPTATAEIVNAQGVKLGKAEFFPTDGGAKMEIHVAHLPPGPKGIHIHDKGVCTAPDFKSAGGHLNPDNKHHGLENPLGHHEGDMANLVVKSKGTAKQEFLLPGVELTGTGPHSLFKAGGTAVVIHAKADDEKTDPAGNAGERIACGVVQAG